MGNSKSTHSGAYSDEVLVFGYVRRIQTLLSKTQNIIIPTEIFKLCYLYYYFHIQCQQRLIKMDDYLSQYAECVGHFGKIYDIAHRPNYIASASQDGKVVMWRVKEPQLLPNDKSLFGHKKIKNRVKFTGSSFNKTVAIPLKSAWVMTVDINHDLSLICHGGLDATITISDITEPGWIPDATYIEIWYFEGFIASAMFLDQVNENGMSSKYVLACSGDGKCAVFDIEHWKNNIYPIDKLHQKREKERRKYKDNGGNPPDDLKFDDPPLPIIDRTPYKLWTISDADCCECDYHYYNKDIILVIFCCENGYLYIADFINSTIKNEKYFAKIKVNNNNCDIKTCQFSPNGQFIATGDEDGFIHIYDIDNLNWVKYIDLDNKNEMNGIQCICKYQIPETEDPILREYSPILNVKWLNDECLIVCVDDDKLKDIYYIKYIAEYKWGYGVIKTKHKYKIKALTIDRDNKLIFTASWDKLIGAHDASML